jgi:hypothetical protein
MCIYQYAYFDVKTGLWVQVIKDENGNTISEEWITDPNEYQ